MVGIIPKDDIVMPSGDSVIRPEDRVIIFARMQAITKVEKMLSVALSWEMAADLVYVAGLAGNIYRYYPVCSRIFSKISKIFTIFIDIKKEWN